MKQYPGKYRMDWDVGQARDDTGLAAIVPRVLKVSDYVTLTGQRKCHPLWISCRVVGHKVCIRIGQGNWGYAR